MADDIKPKPKRRRAKLNPTRLHELKQARLAEKAALRAAREAERQARREAEEKKAAEIKAAREAEQKAALTALEAEYKAQLEAKKPLSVVEFCRAHGLPADIPYHPRYAVVGVHPTTPEQSLECICFGRDWPSELGGLGAYGHLKKFIKMTWPHIELNPWLERLLHSLADSEWEHRVGNTRMRFVSWVGAGSGGKTFAAGLFAVCWFLYDLARANGARSSVTLTSTSKGILGQRVWPVIQMLFHEAKMQPDDKKFVWGRMIDSMKTVEPLPDPKNPRRRDSKHTICGVAVEPGELQGSLDKIKGRHTERMLLIIDEANSTPQAIFECIPNMLTSARELIVLVIGNAGSRLDHHGRCCEPKNGWKSITIEDEQWETKGVEQWGIGKGICVHLDGAKSPNVLAGRTEHKHIYSFERWQQVQRMGEEYRNTLQHWSQDRGFWPPDGISTTIFSEAMVISHDGTGRFDWLAPPRPCAALDPAFGGDDCVLQMGLLGDVRGPRKALQLTESTLVPFDPDSQDPIEVQIARWVIKRCTDTKVDPEMFGLDATGTGRGVSAFIKQMWSPRILGVEFGGSASDLPASMEDPRPSNEVYGNRVTELWYVCRDLLVAEQLKGLFPQMIKEFCSRLYEFTARRYKVEPKGDMKARLGYSPDRADSGVVLVEVCRRNGGLVVNSQGNRRIPRKVDEWQAAVNEVESLSQGAYGERQSYEQYVDV